MESKAEHEKVAQVIRWVHSNGSYTVEVVNRDGETIILYNVTDDQWAAIKAEELEHELAERNVETDAVRDILKLPAKIENLEDVKQFLAHCREWVGACFNLDMRFADYTKIDSDDEQAVDDDTADEYDDMVNKAFAVCKKFGADIYKMALDCEAGNAGHIQDFGPLNAEQARRKTLIASCREENAIHLCAWCRSYVMAGQDGDDTVLITLTDDEFEATRKTGESHGICKQCKDGQVAACRDMKADREANEKIGVLESRLSIVAGQRDSALTELSFANAEILVLRDKADTEAEKYLDAEAANIDLEIDFKDAENAQCAARDLLTNTEDQLSAALTEVNRIKDVIARMEIERDVMQLELDDTRVKLENTEGK